MVDYIIIFGAAVRTGGRPSAALQHRIDGAVAWAEASSRPLSQDIDEFAASNDLLIVIGWDVDEEPAVLLPAEAVSRCVTSIRSLYPDGFVLLDQPATKAPVVDFDEDSPSVVYVGRVQLLPIK